MVPLALPLSGQILAVQILLDSVSLACCRRRAMPYQDSVWELNPPVDLLFPSLDALLDSLWDSASAQVSKGSNTGAAALAVPRRPLGNTFQSHWCPCWSYNPLSPRRFPSNSNGPCSPYLYGCLSLYKSPGHGSLQPYNSVPTSHHQPDQPSTIFPPNHLAAFITH